MPPRKKTVNELRCFCAHEPLLAVYGLTQQNKIYIHVRIYKQRRLFGEMFFEGGTVQLKCRDCFRWYKVEIKDQQEVELKELESPPDMHSEESHNP